jgi:hypothetical protein
MPYVPRKYAKTSSYSVYKDPEKPLDRKNIYITLTDELVRQMDRHGSRKRSAVAREAIAKFKASGENYLFFKDPLFRSSINSISLSMPPAWVEEMNELGRGQRSRYCRVAIDWGLREGS